MRLELVWPGKDKFLLVPRDECGKPVWVDRSHPAAVEVRVPTFETAVGDVSETPAADNLLFTGDSLDALLAAVRPRCVLASRVPEPYAHANAQHDQPALGSWTDKRTRT